MVPGLLLIGGGQNKQIDSPLITNTLAVTGSNETQLPHPPKACYSCVIFGHFFLISKIKYLVLFYFVKLNIFIVFFLFGFLRFLEGCVRKYVYAIWPKF